MMLSKVIIVVYIGLLGSNAVAQEAENINVRAAKIELADLYEVFSVVGQCKNSAARDYYAKVSGNLEIITTKQGNKVSKGEILLVIDQAIAVSIKSKAQTMLKFAEASYKRSKLLYHKKYISNSEIEKAQLEFAETALDFDREMDTYNSMYIIAPFDGEIGVIKPRVGDKIQQGDYLFSIIGQDVGIQSILVELPAPLFARISKHDELIVTNNKGNKIKGQVANISQYLSNNGTISARIIVDSKSDILHGSYVNVDWLINKHKNLAIASQAIQSNNQGDFIYKINNNVAKKLYVKLGNSVNGLTEIISNEIKEGDLIVVEGLTKVTDGSYVNLLAIEKEG